MIFEYLNKVYKNNNCIFFYYWNSCIHCREFKPIFNYVIHDLIVNDEDFIKKAQIFQIELDNFDLLPNEFKDVQTFPSVIAYSNGKKIDEFKEQRTKSNLNKFILNSIGEPSVTYKGTSSTKVKKVLKKYTSPKSV